MFAFIELHTMVDIFLLNIRVHLLINAGKNSVDALDSSAHWIGKQIKSPMSL